MIRCSGDFRSAGDVDRPAQTELGGDLDDVGSAAVELDAAAGPGLLGPGDLVKALSTVDGAADLARDELVDPIGAGAVRLSLLGGSKASEFKNMASRFYFRLSV